MRLARSSLLAQPVPQAKEATAGRLDSRGVYPDSRRDCALCAVTRWSALGFDRRRGYRGSELREVDFDLALSPRQMGALGGQGFGSGRLAEKARGGVFQGLLDLLEFDLADADFTTVVDPERCHAR